MVLHIRGMRLIWNYHVYEGWYITISVDWRSESVRLDDGREYPTITEYGFWYNESIPHWGIGIVPH